MKNILIRLAMLPCLLFLLSLLLLIYNQFVFSPWYEPVLIGLFLCLSGYLISRHYKLGFLLMGMIGAYEYLIGMYQTSDGYYEKLMGGCLILYMIFLLVIEDVLTKKSKNSSSR